MRYVEGYMYICRVCNMPFDEGPILPDLVCDECHAEAEGWRKQTHRYRRIK